MTISSHAVKNQSVLNGMVEKMVSKNHIERERTLMIVVGTLLIFLALGGGASAASDLTVTSVSFTHSSASPGQSISVTFTIKNQGNSASGSFYNKISLGNSVYGTTYSLGDFSMSSLNAGDSRTVTIISNSIPSSVPAGSYYVTVFTDGKEALTESNEDNNIGSSNPNKLTVTQPDLTVTSVSSTPSSASPGESISVKFTIKNQGNSASGSFYNKISLGNSVYGTTYPLGDFSMISLDAGDSRTVTITSNSIPSSVPAGSYYVTVYTDGKEALTESNEDNNIGSSDPNKLTVTPAFSDLIVSSIVSFIPSSVTAGQSISVTFTIKNQGISSSGTFNNRISLSTSTYGTTYPLGDFPMSSLDPGKSRIVTITSNIVPSSVPAGSYYVTVYTDGNEALTESDEDNNIGSSDPTKLLVTGTTIIPVVSKPTIDPGPHMLGEDYFLYSSQSKGAIKFACWDVYDDNIAHPGGFVLKEGQNYDFCQGEGYKGKWNDPYDLKFQTAYYSMGTHNARLYVSDGLISDTDKVEWTVIERDGIKRPSLGNPAIVKKGDSFTIEVQDKDATQSSSWNIEIYKDFPISITPTISGTSGYFTLQATVPSETAEGMYNLKVKVGTHEYTWPHAVNVISEYKKNFSFVHLADIHIGYSGKKGCSEPTKDKLDKFNEIIKEINIIKPDMVLISGDLVDFVGGSPLNNAEVKCSGGYTNFPNYVQMFRNEILNSKVPIFTTTGNHDYRLYARPDVFDFTEEPLSYYDMINPKKDYSFNYGENFFISLNSGHDSVRDFIEIDGTPEGNGLSNDQMGRLTSFLTDHQTSNMKFVFMHHPIFNETSDNTVSDEGYTGNDASIAYNRGNFIRLVEDKKVRMVLGGHTHWDKIFSKDVYGNYISLSGWGIPSEFMPDGTLYITSKSSTIGADSPQTWDQNRPGFRLIKINGDKIESLNTHNLDDPYLVASKESIDLGTVKRGSIVPSTTLAVKNAGGSLLSYTLSYPDWIKNGPNKQGTLSAKGAETAVWNFDIDSSKVGTFSGTIEITYYLIPQPSQTVQIPVSIKIPINVVVQAKAKPDIRLTPPSWNFGTVGQGKSLAEAFTIENSGTAGLTITSISKSHSDISITGITFPKTISSGNSELFKVDLSTTQMTGQIQRTITVNSNDPDEPAINIPITGYVNQFGTIYASSSPIGADVYINGIDKGTSPSYIGNLAKNTYTVRFSKADYNDCQVEVDVILNEEVTASCTLVPLTQPNNPPNIPGNPSPSDIAINQPVNPTLSWSGGDPDQEDTVKYSVYLDTNTDPITSRCSDTTSLSCSVSGLEYNNKYYWKVVSSDGKASQISPVWSFTTEAPSQTTPPPASTTTVQITTNSSDQDSPSISGNRIVWVDKRNGNLDIYMYDLSTNTENTITTNSADQYKPSISENRIVWEDKRNGNSEIYMYDLSTSTEKRITTNSAHQWYPDISGNRIVWQDKRNGNWDIYMYDLSKSTEKRITTNSASQTSPSISGNRIVWQDYRNGNWDIYIYDLSKSTEKRITTNNSSQTSPSISENNIVWKDERNGNRDIYMYDLSKSTEKQVTTNTTEQRYPSISINNIVWEDRRNGNWDIYMYDLSKSTEKQITTNNSSQTSPSISGNNIVWKDQRNGNWDIYMYNLSI